MKLPDLEGSSESRGLFWVHVLTGTSIIKQLAQDVTAASGPQEWQSSNWTQGVAGLQPVWVLSDHKENLSQLFQVQTKQGILLPLENFQATLKA